MAPPGQATASSHSLPLKPLSQSHACQRRSNAVRGGFESDQAVVSNRRLASRFLRKCRKTRRARSTAKAIIAALALRAHARSAGRARWHRNLGKRKVQLRGRGIHLRGGVAGAAARAPLFPPPAEVAGLGVARDRVRRLGRALAERIVGYGAVEQRHARAGARLDPAAAVGAAGAPFGRRPAHGGGAAGGVARLLRKTRRRLEIKGGGFVVGGGCWVGVDAGGPQHF
eukprot:1181676-Prorocentrum_minimum.AAC.1